MKATLIFDSVNDLLFSKWDDTFIQRMKCFNEQVLVFNNFHCSTNCYVTFLASVGFVISGSLDLDPAFCFCHLDSSHLLKQDCFELPSSIRVEIRRS